MDTSHRVSTPGADQPIDTTPKPGLSVGAVVAIAISSTFVGAFFIACFCLWLARRRQRNAGLQPDDAQFDHLDWEEIETNSTDPRRPRKLQKKHKEWENTNAEAITTPHDTSAESSDTDELMREISPIHPTPLPQLPPFKKSLFASVFRSGSSPARSHRSKASRTSSPEKPEKAYRQMNWIDEDVLHGPKVKSQRPAQPVVRDSWPLYSRLASPTLPVVLSSDMQGQQYQGAVQYQAVGSQYQPFYQNYPQVQFQGQYGNAPPPQFQPSQFQPPQQFNAQGQRYLPLPPRPALITGNSVTQAMGAQYYDFQALIQQSQAMMNQVQQAQTAPVRHQQQPQQLQQPQQPIYELSAKRKASTDGLSKKRKASTDSTLSEILKSTEQRLMEGSPTKSRPGTASTAMTETIKRVPYTSRENLATGGSETEECRSCESPTKLLPLTYSGQQQGAASGHQRRGSETSINSDMSEDSTFGLPVVPPESHQPTGLSCPSRTPTKADKSPSGSLSTIADEDEAEAHEKLEEMEARYLAQIAALSSKGRATKTKSMPAINDPFVSPNSSPSRKAGKNNRESLRRVRSLRMANLGVHGDSSQLPPLPPDPPKNVRVSVNLEEELPNQAKLGVLPLDLYQVTTPVRHINHKTPVIVPANPDTMCDSVKAKRSRQSLIMESSPTSEVKDAIARATVPGLRLSKGGSNKQPQTSSPRNSPPKVVPPPHQLRPKGSSPTLGQYSGAMRTIGTPGSLTGRTTGQKVVIGHHRTSSGQKVIGHHRTSSIRNRSLSGVSRHSSTLSHSSSVYSQDSFSDLPQITIERASNHGDSPAPVLATVAALRRMNSVVSTGSGPSETGSPLRSGSGEWVAGGVQFTPRRKHKKGRGSKGSRNYLGLLELKESPEKTLEERRNSTDSLGLYDDDGFLISSPVRGGERDD